MIYDKNIFKIHKIVKKYQTNDISFVFGKFADLYMLKGLSVNTKSFIGIFYIISNLYKNSTKTNFLYIFNLPFLKII